MKNKPNHIRKGLPGFTLMWRDDSPLDDKPVISNDQVTHTNPIRRLTCFKVWQQHHKYILTNPFVWLVSVNSVFHCPRKLESNTKIENGEFEVYCCLRVPSDTRLSDAIEAYITEVKLANALLDDNHKNKGEYLYTEFKATIVGL